MVEGIQTALTVGMPTLAVLVGILVNNSRLWDLRSYIDARFGTTDTRFSDRFSDMEKVNEIRFKLLLGKIEDIDNFLTRPEERFAR